MSGKHCANTESSYFRRCNPLRKTRTLEGSLERTAPPGRHAASVASTHPPASTSRLPPARREMSIATSREAAAGKYSEKRGQLRDLSSTCLAAGHPRGLGELLANHVLACPVCSQFQSRNQRHDRVAQSRKLSRLLSLAEISPPRLGDLVASVISLPQVPATTRGHSRSTA